MSRDAVRDERSPLVHIPPRARSPLAQHPAATADVERADREPASSRASNALVLRRSTIVALALIALVALVSTSRLSANAALFGGSDARARALALANAMSLDEQLTLLGGKFEQGYVGATSSFEVAANGAKVPELRMNDGPQGFRAQNQPGTTTQWPCALAVAATFDVGLAHAWGAAMGKEFAAKGANVFLGPGMNLARVPLGGRNFEYIAGEDPTLGSAMAAAVIKGVQSRGVIATAKHFIFNEQEADRMYYDARVDERAMRELYLPMFEASIKEANVGSIMCSYNMVNGSHACQNSMYLNDILRGDLGFEGFVMSDWLATHSTAPALQSGLDMEMPTASLFARDRIKNMIGDVGGEGGGIDESLIKTAAQRVLTAMFSAGVMDREPLDRSAREANVRNLTNTELARNIVVKSTILLKNDGNLLPLDARETNKTIITFGPFCQFPWALAGGGSGHVDPGEHVVTINAGLNSIATNMQSFLNDQLDRAILVATELGENLQAIVMCEGDNAGESLDRTKITLDGQGTAAIRFSEKFRDKLVLIITAPGHVAIPYHDKFAAVLLTFMPGEQAGLGIADVVFGKRVPGGKLPLSIPNGEHELGNFDHEQYPGTDGKVIYKEGLNVGYRWYNVNGLKPAFPFGHGLSYSTFTYDDFAVEINRFDQLTSANVTFSVTNTGIRTATEVAQVYVTFPEESLEPPRQLKAFHKLVVYPGRTEMVQLTLPKRAMQIWSVDAHAWVDVPGQFRFFVGGTSDPDGLISCTPSFALPRVHDSVLDTIGSSIGSFFRRFGHFFG